MSRPFHYFTTLITAGPSCDAQISFIIPDQFARKIYGHLANIVAKGEGAMIIAEYRFTKVIATTEAHYPKYKTSLFPGRSFLCSSYPLAAR
jgi:hypothetical protein